MVFSRERRERERERGEGTREIEEKNLKQKTKKQVDTKCSPVAIARAAIDDARAMCSREYGGAPDVVVYG